MTRAAGANIGMAGSEQESLEKLHDRLREAKSVERELRNELARANLERGSMETMVGWPQYRVCWTASLVCASPVVTLYLLHHDSCRSLYA